MKRKKETLTEYGARLGVEVPEPRRPIQRTPAQVQAWLRTTSDDRPASVHVQALIDRLEFEKFQTMGDRPRWDDLHEVQELARAQLKDDVPTEGRGSRRARIGGTWVDSSGVRGAGGEREQGEPIWRSYTPEQVALERGFAGFLAQLTEKQRDALRLAYWARDDERTAAAKLGITRRSYRDRLYGRVVTREDGSTWYEGGALKALGRLVRRAFTATDEELDQLLKSAEEAGDGPEEAEEMEEAPSTTAGPVLVRHGRTSALFPAYTDHQLKEVIATGTRRQKDGQINRQLDPETYARLVRNRSQAAGDLAAAEGHHFALTRVLDRALTEGDDE